jgi:hypothetical protein
MKKALKPRFDISDETALTFANTVAEGLKNNAHFPSPQPGLPIVQAAQTAFKTSMSKAIYGGRDDKAQKNAHKKLLISLLHELCDYVNMTAQGNLVMLSTCGFPLSKDRQALVLGTPAVKVALGASGKAIVSTLAVKGAKAYKYQYTTDPTAAIWPEVVSSKSKCIIENLIPGTIYSMRIVAIGTNNQVTVSDVVTRMVV